MGKRIEPLSTEQWQETGRKLKEAKAVLREMSDILSGHIPAVLLDQVLKARSDGFHKLQSRLEDEMFRQHPKLSREAISVFYGNKEGKP